MKRVRIAATVIFILLSGALSKAEVSMIMNGSFENNGIINDITVEAPYHWCDINVPADKFGGKVNTDWWTHSYSDGDGNSLTVYSKSSRTFAVGDIAAVSQQVYLKDVNEIIFDIELSGTHSLFQWDPEKFSAVVQVDGTDVWDSNILGALGDGEYSNVTVDINDIGINDANLHTLSLAMRANKNETQYFQYQVRWDFVKFDAHCGGFGYLPADINHDCYVDMLDLKMLASQWLEGDPAYKYDLAEDIKNIVNLRDFAALAGSWLDNTYWENWQDDNCFEIQLPAADINYDGIINLIEFATLAEDWDDGTVDYEDISALAEQWLRRSWLYGLE